jgi:AcrR family transcriptional regulator
MAGRKKVTNGRGSSVTTESKPDLQVTAPESEDSGSFNGPRVAGLVKSQVENLARINKRRSQFVRTAIELFSRNGYHATTVKEIAEAAGVSPGLIYQYVTDKEDILFLALQLIVHTNKLAIPAAMEGVSDPVDRFIAAFEAYCRVFDANRSACLLTYRESKSLHRHHLDAIKSMEQETNKIIFDCVTACVNEGYFRDLNVELFVYQTIMVAHTWALKHWRLGKITDIDKYISFNADGLMNIALTREGWSRYLDHVRTKNAIGEPKTASLEFR